MLSRNAADIPRGTLDMLILKVLSLGENHGYGIARRIHDMSDSVLTAEEGSLYPALARLVARGHVTYEVRPSESNRRAKYYRLTATGRRQLTRETETWEVLTRAIATVLGATKGGTP